MKSFIFLKVYIFEDPLIFEVLRFLSWCLTLHEKCPYSEKFWYAFFDIRTECGEKRSDKMRDKRKNADQNNSEYGHFLRSLILEVYREYNLLTITKYCFPLWFYNKNQSSATIMISVVAKGTVSLVKLKLEREMFK